MSDDLKARQQAYPFANGGLMAKPEFQNGLVSLLGKVDKVNSPTQFILHTTDDKEVTIELTEGGDSAELTLGKAIEVRGTVVDSSTLRVVGKDFCMYDSEFDMQSYEQMLDYYHGMCRKLTIAA